jgi:hypothetical protein
MELLRGGSQAAMADDFEEGAGEVDVHGAAGVGSPGIVSSLTPFGYPSQAASMIALPVHGRHILRQSVLSP